MLLISGGEECGLWRSHDGGDTWKEITRKPGLPKGMLGKIGVACRLAGGSGWGRVWALIEAEDGALFRSDDGGTSWERAVRVLGAAHPRPGTTCTSPPTRATRTPSTSRTTGCGSRSTPARTFLQVPTPHGDDHALWIDPRESTRMIEGNDGGACVSFNAGQSWSTIYNQPTAQLYHVTTDNRFPYRVYASQQDNTAISIPSRSPIGAITERDWVQARRRRERLHRHQARRHRLRRRLRPDRPALHQRHHVPARPQDQQDWQNTVWPELYGWGVGAETLKYRFNWTFPIHYLAVTTRTCSGSPRNTSTARPTRARAGRRSAKTSRATTHRSWTLGRAGHARQHRRRGLLHDLRLRRVAAAPKIVLWAGTDDGLVHRS